MISKHLLHTSILIGQKSPKTICQRLASIPPVSALVALAFHLMLDHCSCIIRLSRKDIPVSSTVPVP